MIYRAVRRFNVLKAIFGQETFHRVEKHIATEFHGSSYGGWAIAQGSLDENSIVYSIGIGQDVSFDLSLIDRYQLKIYAYDPTPQSISWVRSNVICSKFLFQPIAINDSDGSLTFYGPNPQSADQVSASIHKSHLASQSYTVPCQSFEAMLKSNGHTSCDVLKLDIEGAEYSVLKQLCASGLIRKVGQLLVEFHHFFPGIAISETNSIVKVLREHGFKVAWISRTNHEYLFVRSR